MSLPRVWIDVEDVMLHLIRWGRPTGIQRLSFEAARALVAVAGEDRIRFLRHARGGMGFYEIPYAALSDAYMQAVTLEAARGTIPGGGRQSAVRENADPSAQTPERLRRAWQWVGNRLPSEVRAAMLDVLVPLWSAARAVPRFLSAAWRAQWRVPRTADGARTPAEAAMRPGDVLFALAAPWNSQHMDRVIVALEPRGLRYAALVYDLIPVMRPEFSMTALRRRYHDWARRMLPICDVPMAISQATRRDIERFAAREGVALRSPVRVMPIGTGFPSVAAVQGTAPATDSGIGEPYVLCVSTIEVRKNHLLLLRAWRRLLEEMPAGTVPKLVFAGDIGWLVDDMLQQLRNASFLDGRVEMVDSPSDARLAALYRGAMFTVYAAHYEGWGLPVVESHAFGTPVVCADNTSLPEAGGTLARYFESDNVGDAVRVIRGLLENPGTLAAWRDEVRARFRPVEWRATAAAMLAAMDAPADAV